jgi:hypothetical protein
LRTAANKRDCRHPCDINLIVSRLPRINNWFMSNKLLHNESAARYIHDMQVKIAIEYCYIGKGNWRWRNWNHPVCLKLSRYFAVSIQFHSISKYEADVEHSVVSLISSSLGYIESTYEWNWLLLTEKMSIYRNVELKYKARDCLGFFSSHADLESYMRLTAFNTFQLLVHDTYTTVWYTIHNQ